MVQFLLGKNPLVFFRISVTIAHTHRNTQQYYTEIMMIGMLFLLTMEKKNQLQEDSILKKKFVT